MARLSIHLSVPKASKLHPLLIAVRILVMASNLLERKFISDVDSLIAENLSNSEFCVDNITASLGMSRTLLHNRMKSLTGMSISEYIREKRLAEAGRLLADGFNVSETAYRCGFADPSHFSKVFKRKFGVPSEPLRWKKQVINRDKLVEFYMLTVFVNISPHPLNI